MAQEYYTILTNAGLAYEAQSKANQTPIRLTHLAVGDGNGAAYNPGQEATALRRETHRQEINALLQDEANPSWLLAEALLPDDVGGFTIREVGIYTDTGILYAIGKYPDSVKPILAQGSTKQFYVRAIFQTSNASIVTLVVDNNVVQATRAYVQDYVKAELGKLDHKNSVRAATTANITLSGTQTIDGIALVAGDRVLVKNQVSGATNGIYVVAGGAWSRAADADASIEVTPGMIVPVEQGTANADSVWQLATDGVITLGTTALTFEASAGPSGVSAGTYRSVTVDKRGRVSGGTNPTTLGGYGITDGLKTGDHGLGPIPIVSTEINLDAYTVPLNYITPQSGLINLPASWPQDRYLLQIFGGGSSGVLQLLTQRSAPSRMAFRVFTGTVWSVWNEVYHSGNLGSSAPLLSLSRTTTLTSSTTLSAAQTGLVLVDANAGDRDITLPPSDSALGVVDVILRRIDGTANVLNVIASGSDKIMLDTTAQAGGQSSTEMLFSGDWLHLRSNGAGKWWCIGQAELPANLAAGLTVFNSSGTYTVPPILRSGRRHPKVKVIGGGGGAGRFSKGGGGGGGGGLAQELVDLTGVPSVPVTVGAGGAGRADSSGIGTAGGTSSFGAYLSATGGSGGSTWLGGPSGTGQGGTINTGLGPGNHATRHDNGTAPQSVYGGGHGGGPGGIGSGSGTTGAAGGPATLPGGGGGGGNEDGNGGNGAPGQVIIEW